MPDYSAQIREMGSFVRGEGDAPSAMPKDRAAVYRDLVLGAVSGLLQTNLPRTHALLSHDMWNTLIAEFMASRAATTPYFHEIAAQFSAFVDARENELPYLSDLVHFETVQLAVETACDDSITEAWSLTPYTRIAAYRYNVLASPPHEEPTFIAITRDDQGSIQITPMLAVDFAVLTTLSENATPNVPDHWREQVLQTYLDKGIVCHSGNLVR